MIRPDQPTDPQNLTPDGLISDVFVMDKTGREVAYVSPEARARINADRDAQGLPRVAGVQPDT